MGGSVCVPYARLTPRPPNGRFRVRARRYGGPYASDSLAALASAS